MEDAPLESCTSQPLDIYEFPSSSEDVNEILDGLRHVKSTDVIRRRLSQIVVYIRCENRSLRSRATTEGDDVVAEIEHNLIGFLDSCSKRDFEAFYPQIRELVAVIPKPDVFGIDIVELREQVEDYHEDRSPDSPFYSIAEEIREAVHRRLSGEVLNTIEELLAFLDSEDQTAMIAGRYCRATSEDKEEEKASERFRELLDVRDKLKLIWSDPFSRRVYGAASADRSEEVDRFISSAVIWIRHLLDPCRDEIRPHDSKRGFLGRIEQITEALNNRQFEDIEFGVARYHLKNLITEIVTTSKSGRGRLALKLMALDCVLENLSLVYYSNIVNIGFATIDGSNYRHAVAMLPDLALCTRALGHGTKSMGRFAFAIKRRVDRGESDADEIQTIVREMGEELLRSIFNQRQALHQLLLSSEWHRRYADIDRLHTRLLNDIVREKTTHLYGNLLNSMGVYIDMDSIGVATHPARSRIPERFRRTGKKGHITDLVFRFGPDISVSGRVEERAWTMGGKGASQEEMSRLVTEFNLKGVDVPKGFGLSTRTWPRIKENLDERELVERDVRREVRVLEARTGKRFGGTDNPLLLAARSGAVVSLPGILPTISHIGLNEQTVEQWSESLEQPQRAYHAYLRFLFNYAENVFWTMGIKSIGILERLRASRIADLCVKDIRILKETVQNTRKHILELTDGLSVPDDVHQQLIYSIYAVFSAYEREEVQRQAGLKHVPSDHQTACLVQDCLPVLSDDDCSGVFLTKDPRSGGPGHVEFVRDFGEDLSAGKVVPRLHDRFRRVFPEQFERLEEVKGILEKRYLAPNDIEFSVRGGGKLYIVQNRLLPMVPMASVISDYDFYQRGLINDTELVKRTRRIVSQPVITTYLDEADKKKQSPVAAGQPISGGVVVGRIVCDESKIKEYDDDIIFITKSNVPRELTQEPKIKGYLSEEGGATSHAALISIGKIPCIVGVSWYHSGDKILIGERGRGFAGHFYELREGDLITLDANEGFVYAGVLPIRATPADDPRYLEAEAAIKRIIARINAYSRIPRGPEPEQV